MKRITVLLLLVAGTLVLAGCATTNITSQADVSVKAAPYETVMVIASFDDLDLRKLAEGEMKVRLAAHGVTAVPSSEVFFPGAYSAEEAKAKITETRIDAILVISAYDAGVTETYHPPSYYTQGSAWVYGNTVSSSSTTQAVGGGTSRQPWAKFSAELMDVAHERRVWIATGNSHGLDTGFSASAHTLLRSFCGQVMNQLVVDGVMKPAVVTTTR